MSLLRIIALMSVLCSAAALATPGRLPQEMISVLPTNGWISGRLVGEDTLVGRAATVESDEPRVILALDTEEGQCGLWRVALLLPAEAGFGTEAPLEARLVVDGGPSHELTLYPTIAQGRAHARFALRDAMEQATLLEIQNGRELLIAVGRAQYRFLLHGAAGALDRAARICSGAEEAAPIFPPTY